MVVVRSLIGHGIVVLVGLPLCCLVPALLIGPALVAAEGWRWVDAVLYVVGDLVLLTVTPVVPVTPRGRAVDFFGSCVSFAVFSWLLSLLGGLPLVASSKSFLYWMTGHNEEKEERGQAPQSATFVTLGVFILVGMPVVFLPCAVLLGGPLALIEGWSFSSGVFFALGVIAQCSSLSPTTELQTDGGRFFALLVAIYALAVALGWVCGVFLLMPSMDALSKLLGRGATRLLHLEGTFLGKFLAFFAVSIILVPALMLPVAACLGASFTALEGWSLWDGLVRVAGNIVLVPLSSKGPETMRGKVVDFAASISGVGLFGFIIVTVGALPFVDDSADRLGGKRDGVGASLRFAARFFLLVLPLVCATVSLPAGAFLAAAEGWPWADGWLYAMGIMVQAPGLPPASLEPSSAMGKLALFVVACWSLCISLGWGVGVIVASAGLDLASRRLAGLIDPGLEARRAAAASLELEAPPQCMQLISCGVTSKSRRTPRNMPSCLTCCY